MGWAAIVTGMICCGTAAYIARYHFYFALTFWSLALVVPMIYARAGWIPVLIASGVAILVTRYLEREGLRG